MSLLSCRRRQTALQFSSRYSSDDPVYQEYVSRPADPPPIVENWNRRFGNSRGRDNRSPLGSANAPCSV
ncbi:hypothetical protein CRUP_019463 [Coryphaenoides rupestris]|nr:hypothetical protein CRUP_019463 [Coryphaenoides rupestris]